MRRIVALLLVTVLFLAVFVGGISAKVSAESLYIRKIVSVVYDDSGSMFGDKWAYANYAMQTFCGMLNSEDQLYITYMSHSLAGYPPAQVDLSAGGIQASVDAIRNHTDNSSTPYQAVEKAFDKLKSVQDSNPNTQYWLVVITDGTFDTGESVNQLNQNFTSYAQETMPNGTAPQITFLAIGDKVRSPEQNEALGIYTEKADTASGIISAMARMADRISGRTRLSQSDIRQVDDYTVSVSSAIPLLNIAVLSQRTSAVIQNASHSDGTAIPLSRQAALSYPRYDDLEGGAFLLGDSQKVIGAGTYQIRFDEPVRASDLVVLFEPALEMRMQVQVNGKELKNHYDLANVSEGDQLSASCKIYEMGTDREVSPDLLPPNTRFEITLKEEGQVVAESAGKDMALQPYTLKRVENQLTATVYIPGFNPITYQTKFTPQEYVPKIEYTMTAGFGSEQQSVKLDQIASNQDLQVVFTLYADGVAMTDPNAVSALMPQITVSPEGNSGITEVAPDGTIVFTPNAASTTATAAGYFDVTVTCNLEDVSASQTYRVLLAEYEVIPVSATTAVEKHQFYGNQTAVSFYITKDGVRLDKQAVGSQFTITLSDGHEALLTAVSVAEDGTITCLPYLLEEHKLTFWSWWTNWSYYFGLEGSDLEVTLSHGYGTATAVLPVKEAPLGYRVWNVYTPLVLELLLLAAIIAYIVRYITKPKFAPNAALYVGDIAYNRRQPGTHRMSLVMVPLRQYNRFVNLWNPFKELTVSVNGIQVTAMKGNRIRCGMTGDTWYSSNVQSKDRSVIIRTPKDIVNICAERNDVTIREIMARDAMQEQSHVVTQDDSIYYFIQVDESHQAIPGQGARRIILSATTFCYSTVQQ